MKSTTDRDIPWDQQPFAAPSIASLSVNSAISEPTIIAAPTTSLGDDFLILLSSPVDHAAVFGESSSADHKISLCKVCRVTGTHLVDRDRDKHLMLLWLRVRRPPLMLLFPIDH